MSNTYKKTCAGKSIFGCYLVIVLLTQSCSKLIEIDPPKTQTVTETVFADDAAAISAINGIYSQLINGGGSFATGGINSITLVAGLSADEFSNYENRNEPIYANALTPQNSSLLTDEQWNTGYQLIYYCNSVINGLSKSTGVTEPVKKQLMGEAVFVRAFCYFYLTNFYGELPLATSIDYNINNTLNRSSVEKVYELIINDLGNAKSLLVNDYSYSFGEKVRPNKWAAAALLSRVYLYHKEWAKAETEANTVIDESGCFMEPDLSSVFLANSGEAIWQLMPGQPNSNTQEAKTMVIPAISENNSEPQSAQVLSENFLSQFTNADKRFENWINSIAAPVGGKLFYYPYKYKVWQNSQPLTEYYTVLRIGEQFLIRAEARAELDNLSGAFDDLHVIRDRAGLGDVIVTTKEDMLDDVRNERRLELFAEWGHRWFDLKRWNLASAVLAPIKGATWQDTDVLFPIPQKETLTNPNLTQNNGYN